MRILGIDPGLQATGFGVIDTDGPRMAYVASGTIRTSPSEGALLPERLKVIFDGISEVVGRYQPDVAACEIVFVNVNPQATLILGQARGCCLTALVANGLSVSEYTALQLKMRLKVNVPGTACSRNLEHQSALSWRQVLLSPLVHSCRNRNLCNGAGVFRLFQVLYW